MLEKDVLLRSEIRTIYSSEMQQRMKVYFELNEKYSKCFEQCNIKRDAQRSECQQGCEGIYDGYVETLKTRYENNPERLDMQVKNAPLFKSKKRPDRDSHFYRVFGVSWSEVFSK